MNSTMIPRGRPGGALVAAVAATLFWLLYVATAGDPLLGQSPVHPALEVAAILATALLFVLGGGILLIAFLPGGQGATGLQRTLVHAVLAFVAAYFTLSYYGWDMSAALTTSAILTAAIGFAMQPTLGSVISGVVLNMDHRLRVGDGIIRAGEAIEVQHLGWRNVVGRKGDGRLVVFPNAKLADAELEFVPAGWPVRAEAFLTVPAAMPPDQISTMVAMLVGDITELDPSRTLGVTLCEFDPGAASARYRIQCWVRQYRDLPSVESQIQARLWYSFHRADLHAPPATSGPDQSQNLLAWQRHAAIADLLTACRPELTAEAARTLVEGSAVVLFGTGECIVLPPRLKGRAFLLLRGELVDLAAFETSGTADIGSQPSIYSPSRVSAERYLAGELARRIGPYAEYAVRQAAQNTWDLEELCVTVAAEIPDDAARAQFLDKVRPPRPASLKPGLLFKSEDTAAGVLIPHRPLRARGEVTLLAIPADLMRILGPIASVA